MPNLRRVGQEAEDWVAQLLIEQGWTIVTRRHKTRHGELDLVALDGDTLVFVEVKYRRTDRVPEEEISERKLNHLSQAIQEYLDAAEVNTMDYRLDIFAIDNTGHRHHRDVFGNR